MYKIDASGLSCPEPVFLLKKAIKNNNSEIILIVDNKTSVETCSRFARDNGFAVTVVSQNKVHELTIKKE